MGQSSSIGFKPAAFNKRDGNSHLGENDRREGGEIRKRAPEGRALLEWHLKGIALGAAGTAVFRAEKKGKKVGERAARRCGGKEQLEWPENPGKKGTFSV